MDAGDNKLSLWKIPEEYRQKKVIKLLELWQLWLNWKTEKMANTRMFNNIKNNFNEPLEHHVSCITHSSAAIEYVYTYVCIYTDTTDIYLSIYLSIYLKRER